MGKNHRNSRKRFSRGKDSSIQVKIHGEENHRQKSKPPATSMHAWLLISPHISPTLLSNKNHRLSSHTYTTSSSHLLTSHNDRTASKLLKTTTQIKRKIKQENLCAQISWVQNFLVSCTCDFSMAAAVCATGFKGGLSSSFHGSWGKSVAGEDCPMLAKTVPSHVRVGKPVRSQPMMGNINEGKGLFAPLVIVSRNIIGKKRFNQLRGKAISLHSQVPN